MNPCGTNSEFVPWRLRLPEGSRKQGAWDACEAAGSWAQGQPLNVLYRRVGGILIISGFSASFFVVWHLIVFGQILCQNAQCLMTMMLAMDSYGLPPKLLFSFQKMSGHFGGFHPSCMDWHLRVLQSVIFDASQVEKPAPAGLGLRVMP